MRESDTEAMLQWLPALGITPPPDAGVKDMRGVGVPVAKFDAEDPLQFFFPRRSLIMHRSTTPTQPQQSKSGRIGRQSFQGLRTKLQKRSGNSGNSGS